MSIKPLDFQVIIPKAAEVSKINNAEQYKGQLLSQQQVITAQQKTEDSLRQVHQQDKANEARIRDRQERRRSQEEKEEAGGDKNGRRKPSGTKESEPERRSVIDIRI